MRKLWIIMMAALLVTSCSVACSSNEVVFQKPEGQEMSTISEEPSKGTTSLQSEAEGINNTEHATLSEEPREIDYTDPNWFAESMIIDLDCDWSMIYLDDLSSKESMMERAEFYFDQLAGTAVTDVAINVYEQISFVQSDTMEWVYEKAANAIKAGEPIDEAFEDIMHKYFNVYKALTEYDVDWMDLAIEAAESRNIRPWMYLRMNDLHYISQPGSPYKQEFYQTAVENNWLIGGGGVYGSPADSMQPASGALNFAHQEVRDWMLAYIEEMVTRYDVFGLHLDFQRNIYCFDYLNEDSNYPELMNDFMRKVNEIIAEAEQIHGHPIKVMVKLCRSIEHNLVFGFDVETWIAEGLVDALVPAPEGYIDSGIPVAQWKQLAGDDVAVFPGFECYMMGGIEPTVEQLKGYGASFYSQGADGLYYNNFYQLGSMGPSIWPLTRADMEQGERTFVTSFQDCCPVGEEAYSPMPMSLISSGDEGTTIIADIGPIDNEEYVYVIAGYTWSYKTEFVTKVTLNGMEPIAEQEITPFKSQIRGDKNTGMLRDLRTKAALVTVYTFKDVTGGEMKVHFTSNPGERCDLEYLEVLVQPDEAVFW